MSAGGRMTAEEFLLLPQKVGWKHELLDGVPHVTPWENLVPLRLDLTNRAPARTPPPGVALRPAAPTDVPRLIPAFVDAFYGGTEYWRLSRACIREDGERVLADHFDGLRGGAHPASRLAATSRSVVGAALVVREPGGPSLDLLFVRPAWRRGGIATALMRAVASGLRAAGEPVLRSACQMANEAGAAWYAALGFVEEPDWLVANARESGPAGSCGGWSAWASSTP
jgi:GNAT superfamily N-acetyltransferase